MLCCRWEIKSKIEAAGAGETSAGGTELLCISSASALPFIGVLLEIFWSTEKNKVPLLPKIQTWHKTHIPTPPNFGAGEAAVTAALGVADLGRVSGSYGRS